MPACRARAALGYGLFFVDLGQQLPPRGNLKKSGVAAAVGVKAGRARQIPHQIVGRFLFHGIDPFLPCSGRNQITLLYMNFKKRTICALHSVAGGKRREKPLEPGGRPEPGPVFCTCQNRASPPHAAGGPKGGWPSAGLRECGRRAEARGGFMKIGHAQPFGNLLLLQYII